MLTIYLTVTAVVAAASFVTFVALGLLSRKAKKPVIDTEAAEAFMKKVNELVVTGKHTKKCVGPSDYTYCGIGTDSQFASLAQRYGRLCEKHQAEYDKIAEPKADMKTARRFARGSMRAWVFFVTSPLWFMGLGFLVVGGTLAGERRGRAFWKDVRAMAEYTTPDEIEEDRLLHMALDPRVEDEPVAIEGPHLRFKKQYEDLTGKQYIPDRQPVYHDSAREKMFFETDSYKAMMGVTRTKHPASVSTKQKYVDDWERKFNAEARAKYAYSGFKDNYEDVDF